MDDKIEAWRTGLLQLVLKHARLYSDHEDAGVVEAAYVAICDYLRTTPEGYRLADEREYEALRKDAERLDYIASNARCDPKMDGMHVWWPTSFEHRLLGGNLREAIDNSLKEQSK